MTSERHAVQMVTFEGNQPQRLDNFLFRCLKGVPKSYVYRIIRRGEVRVDGSRARADTRLSPGVVVRIPPLRMRAAPPATQHSSRVAWFASHICYECDDIIAVNKPRGLAVHGGSGVSMGVVELIRALRPASDIGLVHRLDKMTSGVLLLAKHRRALLSLHEQLRGQHISKYYFACVHGIWPVAVTRIARALRKGVLQSGERMVRVIADGKQAVTEIQLLATSGQRASGFSLLGCRPLTGRTHQIRVHCQAQGHPIVGDEKYGGTLDTRFNGMFLHAASVTFRHPASGQRVTVIAPADAAQRDFLSAIAIDPALLAVDADRQ